LVFEEVLRNLPLMSAVLMYAIVAVQILRDRYKTWTESFFLAGFFFAGTYALADFLFFTAPSYDRAVFAAKVSISSLTMSVLFLLLFTTLFLRSMKRLYIGSVIPALLALVAVWSGMVTGVRQTSWGWVVTYNHDVYLAWLAYIVIYLHVAIINMFRAYRVAKRMSKTIASRTLGIMFALLASLGVGLGTNAYFNAVGIDTVPLFSTVIAIPALATLLVILPLTRERVANASKHLTSDRYEVMATYLVHADGTLIVSRSSMTEMKVDRDIFSATLDVIQNFMRTSFPYLSGKWLTTIEQKNLKILIERGNFTFLALVIKGEETDILRRQMKDLLATFETKNGESLTHWRGIAQEAEDTDKVINAFFARGSRPETGL
jgi:hypothetical protein